MEYNIRSKVKDIRDQLDSKITDYIDKIDKEQEVLLGDVHIPNKRRDTIRSALVNFQSKLYTENSETTEEFNEWIRDLEERLDEEKCIVCFQKWTVDMTDIIVCRHCRSGGHKNHLSNWVKENQFCPLCRQSLRERDLISIDLGKEV